MKWNLPEHKIVLWLDSQKTYRIFENMIVNITKYAMPHTRVYIDNERDRTGCADLNEECVFCGTEFQYRMKLQTVL